MYEAYWQLAKKPFDHGADPRTYYPSEAHQGALLKLRYAVESRCGAALLVGAGGMGKTLLTRLLAEQLPQEYAPLTHVVFPQMPAAELLAYLGAAIDSPHEKPDLPPTVPTLDHSVRRIERFLSENSAQARHAVLVVDEAHLLEGQRTWETLRLLLNFESAGRPSLTLLLVGQVSLVPMLERMPQWDERLGVKCLLRPLTLVETHSYVQHRLKMAGGTRALFEPAAVETLFELTQGVPRKINRLADLSLLIGYAEERKTIGAEQIESVAQELVSVGPE